MAKEYRLEDDLLKKSRPKFGSKRYERLSAAMWAAGLYGFNQCERCGRILLNPQSILIHQGGHCQKTIAMSEDMANAVLDKTVQSEEHRLKTAIISKLKDLKTSGKNILAGTFIANNGDVTLDVTNYGAAQYHICYCCSGRMWNWIIDKTEI